MGSKRVDFKNKKILEEKRTTITSVKGQGTLHRTRRQPTHGATNHVPTAPKNVSTRAQNVRAPLVEHDIKVRCVGCFLREPPVGLVGGEEKWQPTDQLTELQRGWAG